MKPLLNIRSVPISIEHKVTRATLQVKSEQPSVNVTRYRGGLNIQRDPALVKIDSTEARASMGLKTPQRLARDNASESKNEADRAKREYAENGNYILDSHGKGSPVADIATSKAISQYDTVLAFIPSVRPQISVEGGNISFQYNMDKLTFDWNTNNKPHLEYVPGEFQIVVTQYPEVIIEYVGEPIYTPPSANPNYVPPPTIDVKG